MDSISINSSISDEELFKQPPPEEDCAICFLRLPSLASAQIYMACCGKIICSGCIYAVASRDGGVCLCPFCRSPAPATDELVVKEYKRRMELNDATAIYNLGTFYNEGRFGLPHNYAKALELYHQAAELGHYGAYYNIGYLYAEGLGVERNEEKAMHYWELAAMGGIIEARYSLGVWEDEAENLDRALKHYMIAVKSGNMEALNCIKALYMEGHATKDDYAESLRSRQAYVDEIWSDQRDEAAAHHEDYHYK